jgi:hypothetical protein
MLTTYLEMEEIFCQVQGRREIYIKQEVQRVIVKQDSGPNYHWTICEVPEGVRVSNPERGKDEGIWQEVYNLPMSQEKINRIPVEVCNTKVPLRCYRRDANGQSSSQFWIIPEDWKMIKTGKYTGRIIKK